MFNKDALQQLSELKSSLKTEKTLYRGQVRTTTKRFAFTKLDDGREAFLPPDEAQRVLPDDRVEVSLTTNAKDQLEAQLEALIDSPVRQFVGRYRVKGKAHFVEPDLPQFNRWLFVPPQSRHQHADGDLVQCELSRHPFEHQGKGQVKPIAFLGKPRDPGVEARYVAAKFELPSRWSERAQEQAQAINLTPITLSPEQIDLTHLPFVTIDSENTRDMDDALYVEESDEGWQLTVAIADPSRYIEPGTPLDKEARARASTVYLLGNGITMLPTELSHDTFSLVPDQQRPVLICRMNVDRSGKVLGYEFAEAMIRSHHKLSYQGVTELLAGEAGTDAKAEAGKETGEAGSDIPDEVHRLLQQLHQLTTARTNYRHQHALVMEERADYFYVLNDRKKIERVEKRERTPAHRIVEEAMLMTNVCAGELFSKHPGMGIFSNHIGFRPERVSDAVSLLEEDSPDLATGNLQDLPDFHRLMQHLRRNPDQDERMAHLLPLLQRMLQASALSLEASEHFGLGFPHYATVTSPIRRYHDFHNHLAIKHILRDSSQAPVADQALVEQLQQQMNKGRQACRQQEQWLACDYMQDKIGTVHRGTIALVNSFGLGVRLDDLGFEGFVRLATKDGPKPRFDSRRLTLTLEAQTYRLDQTVMVIVQDVDKDQRRIALELVDPGMAERLSVWTDSEPSPNDS